MINRATDLDMQHIPYKRPAPGNIDLQSAQIQATFNTTLSTMELSIGGKINLLARAILAVEQVTTVSPRYANEVLTAEFGAGLESVLQQRVGDLTGILNGIDTVRFDPAFESIRKFHAFWNKGCQRSRICLRNTQINEHLSSF